MSDQTAPVRPVSRDLALDLLKILAILGVLTIHACGLYAFGGRTPSAEEFRDGLLFIAFSTFSIPVFVMASGAMLLSGTRDEAPVAFYRRRLPRLLIPLVCWSAVYFILSEPGWANLPEIPHFVRNLLSGKIFASLWFLYMLLGVYLSAPFLQMLLRQATRSQLWVFVGICLVPGSLQRLFTHVLVLNFGLEHSLFAPYLGYFVLGHLLHTAGPVPARRRLGLFGLYVLLSLMSFGSQWMQQFGGRVVYNFLDYTSINVALGSAALFAALDRLPLALSGTMARGVTFVANTTYGIYLVHMLALEVLGRGLLGFTLVPGLYAPVLNIPLLVGGMFLISLAMVCMLSRIPYLRQTVGFGAPFAKRSVPNA